MDLPPRDESQALLEKYIENPALRHHCEMVAAAMEAYAKKFAEDGELWYQTGLLHDLDYEKFPEEHPFRAVNELLAGYPEVLKHAVLAHGPDLTGVEPETRMERYLFACDELSGFLHAYALMRPNGFEGMKAGKVRLHTVTGSVHTDFPITVGGTLKRTRIEGSIGDGDRRIKAGTVTGSIRLLKR